ncbi:hypothetical protein M501DRAFT_463065 [Patellaria atrata CBS 101060]|nr:hypothetical protein M501DRAFT_463065 [Patellaria atrata CBS 101060]
MSSSNTIKSTVVLNSSTDWNLWIGLIRGKAGTAWKYCDPNDASPPVLSAPDQLTDKDPAAVENHRILYREFEKAQTKLDNVSDFVFESVSTQHLVFIIRLNTLHERLVELKKRLQPDDRATYLDLQARIYRLRSTIKKSSVLDWLQRFETVYTECKTSNHPLYQGHMLEFELLEGLKKIDPQWATSCQKDLNRQIRSIPKLTSQPITQEVTPTRDTVKYVDDVYDLISEFTSYYRSV